MDFDINKDYYKILGVGEEATDDEIKIAFRKAAMKHHPDKGGDQEQFKKINEAYQVIGDKQKRQQYDAYRKGGFGGGNFGGFDFGSSGFGTFNSGGFDIEDIIGSFFGGMGGTTRTTAKKGPRHGDNLLVNMEISFEDSYKGISKELKYYRLAHCKDCGGKGVSKDSQRNKCPICGGKGVISEVKRTPFGAMQTQTACHNCHGEGYIDSKPCQKCSGHGLIKEEQKITLEIPAGIQSGENIKFPGMGNYGIYGGGAGDLYVKIYVKESDKYQRQGSNIIVKVTISIFDAVLGGEVEVNHPENKIKVKIPKGLQVGEKIKVSGKGFGTGGYFGNRGDLIIVPEIKIPKKLTKEEEKLWKELKK